MPDMIGIEGVIIRDPVSEFDINRRVSCFHQLQVHKQPSGSSVAIDKRMDPLKLDMKTRELRHNVIPVCGVFLQKLFHLRFDEVGLYRLMMSAHYANRDSSVDTSVVLFVGKHKIMNLLDDALCQRRVFFYKLTDIIKCFLVPYSLHVIFQRLLIYRQSSQDKISFPERQRIALYRVGVIGVFDSKLLVESLQFSFCQRSSPIQFLFLTINLRKYAFFRFEPSVGRLFCVNGNLPATPFLIRPGDFTFGTQYPDPSVRNSPFFSSFFYSYIDKPSPPI